MSETPTPPKLSASKAAWTEYAAVLGVTVPDGATRDDIVAACTPLDPEPEPDPEPVETAPTVTNPGDPRIGTFVGYTVEWVSYPDGEYRVDPETGLVVERAL